MSRAAAIVPVILAAAFMISVLLLATGQPATSTAHQSPHPATHSVGRGARGFGAGEEPSITHPPFPLLDEDGESVLLLRRPVSAERTCRACHDTDFIAGHSYHASMGLDEMYEAGSAPGSRPWDTSPGLYGRWDPLIYRYLTPPGDDLFDMGTADWIRTAGRLHPGGGPASRSRAGTPLVQLKPGDDETYSFNENTGSRTVWNWVESGVTEFNCFLCHLSTPDNESRIAALREGRFMWATTATLGLTGLVAGRGSHWEWIDRAFDEEGVPITGALSIVPPSSAHCGQCHGLVQAGEEPVIPSYGDGLEPNTETTGLIFSPQHLSRSGMNLQGKDRLAIPWDIHAEWLLSCSDCHFALNDPASVANWKEPTLRFDARRPGLEEFLSRPDHNFAKGRSARGTIADRLDGTMRRCEGCHSVEKTHGWLPYKRRHMDRLLCEACHIPRVRAPARSATDWTVLTRAGGPRVEYRGVRGGVQDPGALVDGYTPVLLPRRDGDGGSPRLAPHNIVTTWYWVHGDPPRPVRLYDLKRAFFTGGSYDPAVVKALDINGDGDLVESELLLNTPAKVAAIRDRLTSLGLEDPRVTAEAQPYSLHHGVVTAGWATRDCMRCHSKPSEISRPFLLASNVPGGVRAAPVGDTNAFMEGKVTIEGGRSFYRPVTMENGFYVLGHDRWKAIDTAGALIVFCALAAVIVHGGIRIRISRRKRSGR